MIKWSHGQKYFFNSDDFTEEYIKKKMKILQFFAKSEKIAILQYLQTGYFVKKSKTQIWCLVLEGQGMLYLSEIEPQAQNHKIKIFKMSVLVYSVLAILNPSSPKGGGVVPTPPPTKFFLRYKNALTYRQTLPYTFKFILCAYFRKKFSTVPPSRGVRCPFKVGMLGGVGATSAIFIMHFFRYFLNRYPFET